MSTYKSLIDGHECQPYHYLAELVLVREAQKHGETLPPKFWQLDAWKKKYKLQIIASHSLLKLFDMQDILDALRSPKANWIYSLSYRGLPDIINTFVKSREKARVVRQDMKNVELDIDNSQETIAKPRTQNRKNLLDSLEGIDVDVQKNSF